MNRFLFIYLALFIFRGENGLSAATTVCQDTLKNYQNFINGKIWNNRYRTFHGSAFLFEDYFLPGTVSINGKTFDNVSVKYDLYSDEVLIPVNNDEIIQLNKEIVDSFSITYENRVYKFIRSGIDPLRSDEPAGYYNLLYSGKVSCFIKYKKSIRPGLEQGKDFEFVQSNQIFLKKDNVLYQISKMKEIFKTLMVEESEFKKDIRDQKQKLSVDNPGSLIPLLKFYDSQVR
jgi:hypothetical protein